MSAFVLLHGFTGSAESWDDVVLQLPAGARVMRPAIYGHRGLAEGPSSFVAEVDRLAGSVAGAGLGAAHLVGYSLGARLGLWLALRHNALFSRVTLIGCHPGLSDERAREQRVAADAGWIEMLEQGGLGAFVSAWQAQPLFASQALLDPIRLERQRQIREGHSARGLAAALQVLGLGVMPCAVPELERLAVPVTLVNGDSDSKFDTLARAMCERLPSAEQRLVPRSGHNLPLEQPAALAALLQAEGEAATGWAQPTRSGQEPALAAKRRGGFDA